MSSSDYITTTQLKATLEMTGLTFADADLASSITSASRIVDNITKRRFWSDDEPSTRVYMPSWSRITIDDVFDVTDVSAISSGTETTLEDGTDYSFLPLNAVADGVPFGTLQMLTGSASMPDLNVPSVSITGTFGWQEVPANVVTATTILATRILRRQREAPFGIVTIGIEQGAVARIMNTDPDVMALLDKYVKEKVLIGLA